MAQIVLGIDGFKENFGELEKGKVYIIAATTGAGKSRVAVKTAFQNWNDGLDVALVHFETNLLLGLEFLSVRASNDIMGFYDKTPKELHEFYKKSVKIDEVVDLIVIDNCNINTPDFPEHLEEAKSLAEATNSAVLITMQAPRRNFDEEPGTIRRGESKAPEGISELVEKAFHLQKYALRQDGIYGGSRTFLNVVGSEDEPKEFSCDFENYKFEFKP